MQRILFFSSRTQCSDICFLNGGPTRIFEPGVCVPHYSHNIVNVLLFFGRELGFYLSPTYFISQSSSLSCFIVVVVYLYSTFNIQPRSRNSIYSLLVSTRFISSMIPARPISICVWCYLVDFVHMASATHLLIGQLG